MRLSHVTVATIVLSIALICPSPAQARPSYAEAGFLPVNSQVHAVAFSPDNLILAAGANQRVLLWNLGSGEQLPPQAGYKGFVENLAWRPDSKALAASGDINDPSVRIYKPGAETKVIPIAKDTAVTALAYSASGALLAIATSNKTIQLHDGESGAFIRIIANPDAAPVDLLFTEDDKILLTAGGGLGERILVVTEDPGIHGAIIPPSWQWSTVGYYSRLEVSTGIVQQTVSIRQGGPNARISPDGKHIAFLSGAAITPVADKKVRGDPPDANEPATWVGTGLLVWHIPKPDRPLTEGKFIRGAIGFMQPKGRCMPAWSADGGVEMAAGTFAIIEPVASTLNQLGGANFKTLYCCASFSRDGKYAAAGTAVAKEIPEDPTQRNGVAIWKRVEGR